MKAECWSVHVAGQHVYEHSSVCMLVAHRVPSSSYVIHPVFILFICGERAVSQCIQCLECI